MSLEQEVFDSVADIGRVPREDVHAGMKVYDSGVISSLRLIELMVHIEKRYGIVIRPEELVEENFRDVGAIIAFIRSKLPVESRVH